MYVYVPRPNWAAFEGYGGSVSAATRPEGGAVFTVRLPVA
jgi:C4-dicarboxylate-specific signal transduction histidine kinase